MDRTLTQKLTSRTEEIERLYDMALTTGNQIVVLRCLLPTSAYNVSGFEHPVGYDDGSDV